MLSTLLFALFPSLLWRQRLWAGLRTAGVAARAWTIRVGRAGCCFSRAGAAAARQISCSAEVTSGRPQVPPLLTCLPGTFCASLRFHRPIGVPPLNAGCGEPGSGGGHAISGKEYAAQGAMLDARCR